MSTQQEETVRNFKALHRTKHALVAEAAANGEITEDVQQKLKELTREEAAIDKPFPFVALSRALVSAADQLRTQGVKTFPRLIVWWEVTDNKGRPKTKDGSTVRGIGIETREEAAERLAILALEQDDAQFFRSVLKTLSKQDLIDPFGEALSKAVEVAEEALEAGDLKTFGSLVDTCWRAGVKGKPKVQLQKAAASAAVRALKDGNVERFKSLIEVMWGAKLVKGKARTKLSTALKRSIAALPETSRDRIKAARFGESHRLLTKKETAKIQDGVVDALAKAAEAATAKESDSKDETTSPESSSEPEPASEETSESDEEPSEQEDDSEDEETPDLNDGPLTHNPFRVLDGGKKSKSA